MSELSEHAAPVLGEALHNPLVQLVLDEVVLCLKENNVGKAHRVGMSALMRKPEFSSSSSLLPIMEALEDDAVLFHVLDDTAEGGDDIMVRIGGENEAAELAGMSVIAAAYGRGEGEGIVAVIGPTRMNYSQVIRAVRAAQRVMQDE